MAVLGVAAFLRLAWLGQEGYGNTYYAAAVKSMLTSWHAFFFASFDSAGFVSVDKPPVGLWVQTIAARLFGFSGASLLLPQAVAGILSVGLLYLLVRRAWGEAAGLAAALALALTPIVVVTDRNNTMDSQLILVLLLAAAAASRAAETGRLLPMVGSATLLGVGFNIKMLQADVVAPVFGLMVLLHAPISWRSRILKLGLAGVVLLVASLWWSVAVDLTPPDQRPYVGSSGTNSALSLALGYNGLGRVTEALQEQLPSLHLSGATIDLTVAPGFAPQIGTTGPFRLLRDGLDDQVSWLLPFALVALLAAGWLRFRGGDDAAAPHSPEAEQRARRQSVSLVLWGGWLAVWWAYFSFARFYHLYYLVMLGPAIAALFGIGVGALWRALRAGEITRWLLPCAVALTAALQIKILVAYPEWAPGLVALLAVSVGIGVALAIAGPRRVPHRASAAAATTSVLVLLAAPAVWSTVSARDGNGGAWLPQAGPARAAGFRFGQPPGQGRGAFPVRVPDGDDGLAFAPRVRPGQSGATGGRDGRPFFRGGPPVIAGGGGQAPGGGAAFGPGAAFGARGEAAPGAAPSFGGPRFGGPGAMTFAGQQWDTVDPGLVTYLRANQGSARFLVATDTSSYASVFELLTDEPAMAIGGYQGWDRILTPSELAADVEQDVVRFFLVEGGAGFRPGAGASATGDLTDWVRQTCTLVPAEAWQTGAQQASAAGRPGARRPGLAQELYDCGSLQASAATGRAGPRLLGTAAPWSAWATGRAG